MYRVILCIHAVPAVYDVSAVDDAMYKCVPVSALHACRIFFPADISPSALTGTQLRTDL